MTFGAFLAIVIAIPFVLCLIAYIWFSCKLNRNASEVIAISVGVLLISMLILSLIFYSPQLYKNSYNKVMAEKPTCILTEYAESLACKVEYLNWKIDSAKVTKNYLEHKKDF